MSDRPIDFIDILNRIAPTWRDYPSMMDSLCDADSTFRADLVLAFFRSHKDWMDDVCPAVIDHQLEWIVQVMDNANACDVLELTAKSIFNYIKKKAHQWLLEEEEYALAWG
jgi:hypothetical protein